MSEKLYDYKSLVRAYADVHRCGYIHDDFKVFYQSYFETLAEAFNVDFTAANMALKMLFDRTVRSYHAVRHPAESALDDTLTNLTLERLGERGEVVFKDSNNLADIVKQCREAHLQMLYDLFICMFGEIDKVVTSEGLRKLGFDKKEPRISDYWDEF